VNKCRFEIHSENASGDASIATSRRRHDATRQASPLHKDGRLFSPLGSRYWPRPPRPRVTATAKTAQRKGQNSSFRFAKPLRNTASPYV
jgi:hypothetical protein